MIDYIDAIGHVALFERTYVKNVKNWINQYKNGPVKYMNGIIAYEMLNCQPFSKEQKILVYFIESGIQDELSNYKDQVVACL